MNNADARVRMGRETGGPPGWVEPAAPGAPLSYRLGHARECRGIPGPLDNPHFGFDAPWQGFDANVGPSERLPSSGRAMAHPPQKGWGGRHASTSFSYLHSLAGPPGNSSSPYAMAPEAFSPREGRPGGPQHGVFLAEMRWPRLPLRLHRDAGTALPERSRASTPPGERPGLQRRFTSG